MSLICITARNGRPSQMIMVPAGSPTQTVDGPKIEFGSTMVEFEQEENQVPPATRVRRSVDPGILEKVAHSSSRRTRAFETIFPPPTST